MKLRPVIKFNQTCRASLTRIENENSSSAWWEIPWLPNFLITGHATGLMVLLSSMQFKVKNIKLQLDLLITDNLAGGCAKWPNLFCEFQKFLTPTGGK